MGEVETAEKGFVITRPWCPECRQRDIRRRKRDGFWEIRVLPLLGIYPYTCGSCRARFYRWGLKETKKDMKKVISRRRSRDVQWTQPADSQEFEKLIRQIARSEQELFATPGVEDELPESLTHNLEPRATRN